MATLSPYHIREIVRIASDRSIWTKFVHSSPHFPAVFTWTKKPMMAWRKPTTKLLPAGRSIYPS